MFHDDARANDRLSRSVANKYSTNDWNSDTSAYEALPSYLELEMAAANALARYVEPAEERATKKRMVRPLILSRFSQVEKIIDTGITVIALSSVALISNGHYVKAKTEVSQALLQRALDPGPRNGGAASWNWNDLISNANADMKESQPQQALMPGETSSEAAPLPDAL
jgi:hypothetical protein